jgi:hypothetical protein
MVHDIASSENPTDSATATLYLPTDTSTWQQILNPEQVATILQAWNQAHFGQAKGTPFTIPPLSTMFSWCGTTETAAKLVDGSLKPSKIAGISAATVEILEALWQPIHGVQTISDKITIDKMERGLCNWKESSSTSPSGRHLGHFHTLLNACHRDEPSTVSENCRDNADVTGTDADGPPTHRRSSEEILNAIATVATVAIRHGIILDRWLYVMIEKIPGQPLVHKLRIIHLVEADFNLLVGILWGQRVMAQAEALHALDDQQYHSWKGCSTKDTALLKHIMYDLMCITHSDGAKFNNDAKACYDRIIPNLMSLCGQQLGLPQHIVQAHANLLLNAHYHLKTTLGVIDTFYLNSPEQPLCKAPDRAAVQAHPSGPSFPHFSSPS